MGGYYDAGDHVKFGLPAAFTVTMLAWGTTEYRKEITELNQMGHALWAIRWGTDYFMKAHTQPNVLWAQVWLFLNVKEFGNLYQKSLRYIQPASDNMCHVYIHWVVCG